MTIVRGGEIVFSRAAGSTIDGRAATSDSPMVVASVSKIVVAIAVARLDERGLIDVDRSGAVVGPRSRAGRGLG